MSTPTTKSNRGVPLCCYGKLPIYKDFISLESGKGAPEAFRAWMDKGFGTTWEDYGDAPISVAYPYRVLFAPAQHKDVAVGSIWDSHDADGLRKFPFAFFVGLPNRTVRGFGNGIITGLAPVWQELESRYLSLDGITDITGFYGNFRKSRVNLPSRRHVVDSRDCASRWGAVTVREVATALFGDRCHERWADLLNRLGAAICYAKKTADLALRLPLAASVDGALQIEMWLRFLRRNLRRKRYVPTVCFPQEGRNGNTAFSILWRDPRREDVCLLGERASEYEHAEDLTDSSVAGSGTDSLGPDVAALSAELFEENRSIGEFTELNLPRGN